MPGEGVRLVRLYYPQASAASKPSELQIMRNFEAAMTSLGGTIVWSEKPRSTMKLVKDGKEVRVLLAAEFKGLRRRPHRHGRLRGIESRY
ncbi:MAG: hypothetical protein PHI34_10360 [Acidobacteriota bacterium]|nr:hypothetical protein [Acidobacteriota bacterium]